jgi:CRISPR-associated protein Csb2
MLAFGIRYLNGSVTATEPDAHERVEWPPHPGRVFLALAAAHFQTGREPGEREALLWLEGLEEAPAIRASECFARSVVTQYVPVNDKAGPSKALLQSAPLTRDRQPRSFARAHLENEIAYLKWLSAEPPPPIRGALEALTAKVTRIGHSSSLVQMWVAEESELDEPTWLPDDERAAVHLRVPGPGTLLELERRYNEEAMETFNELQVEAADETDPKARKAAKKRLKEQFPEGAPPRLRPQLSIYQGYARARDVRDAAPTAPGTVFGPHPLVLTLEREDGPCRHLDLLTVLQVTKRWREAILTRSNGLSDRARELLSGHDAEGTPLEGPHLAFLPLAFVGHEHADGRLLGMALALPAGVSHDDRRESLRAVAAVHHLALGRLGRWKVAADTSASPTWNLRPEAWTAHPNGATHWSTVTPVVFDRHPKTDRRDKYQQEVAAMIAGACTRIGLPEPREVIVTPVSAHFGAPPAFAFPRLLRKDGSERRHTHAILVFDEPVCGPILIGAGRYRGYGVGRPVVSNA